MSFFFSYDVVLNLSAFLVCSLENWTATLKIFRSFYFISSVLVNEIKLAGDLGTLAHTLTPHSAVAVLM